MMRATKLIMVIGALALIVALGTVSVGTVMAQTTTPPTATPDSTGRAPSVDGFGLRGFGGRGGFTNFDAMATALNLTPTQLFEQLHSGKTIQEIATAQGVDLAAVQDAANAARVQAQKDAIAQAVQDGKITQEQADWLLQGIEKGYMGKGGFGFGLGRGHGRGVRGLDNGGVTPTTPSTSTPSTGTSS